MMMSASCTLERETLYRTEEQIRNKAASMQLDAGGGLNPGLIAVLKSIPAMRIARAARRRFRNVARANAPFFHLFFF